MKNSITSFTRIRQLIQWIILLLVLSSIVGSISALFLYCLAAVGNYRESHLWLLCFLPIAGVFIVWWYQTYGDRAQRGNNLLFDEYYHPTAASIPWKMAPMVIISTLITHLFGGSAGREGTAVQYGGTVAAQLQHIIPLSKKQRRVLLLCGIAAGFASLFGTPWAGAVFALEMVKLGKKRWLGALSVLSTALLSNWVCGLYGDHLHTHYPAIGKLPELSFSTLLYLSLAGLAFGLTAVLFRLTTTVSSTGFAKIKQAWLRPVVGAILVLLAVYTLGTTKHIGLGIPTIIAAFTQPLASTDFLIKLVLTVITLTSGFKGGEVTPLFFIGATLGNALAPVLPLPMTLLAATGFVAVFSGCTKTPFACTIMGMELFGWHYALFFLLTCFISYWVSGNKGIYSAQKNRQRNFISRL